MVEHAFNPSTQEAETSGFLEFEASLVYKVSFRTARAIQRNPVLKNQKKKKSYQSGSNLYKEVIWVELPLKLGKG